VDAVAPHLKLLGPQCFIGMSRYGCTLLRHMTSQWRVLRGPLVDPAPTAGKRSVFVNVSRHSHAHPLRCEVLHDGVWLRRACDKTHAVWTQAEIVDGKWRLPVPDASPGTMNIRIRATDMAGNVSPVVGARVTTWWRGAPADRLQ
jgi:hypothetical protein